MAEAPQHPIPYAQRRAEEISGLTTEIREQFQSHRKTCSVCADGTAVCSVGMELAGRIKATTRPQVSADAKYIVRWMLLIFVALPAVAVLIYFLSR